MIKNQDKQVIESTSGQRYLTIENIMLGEREFVQLTVKERICNGERETQSFCFSVSVAGQVARALTDHLTTKKAVDLNAELTD